MWIGFEDNVLVNASFVNGKRIIRVRWRRIIRVEVSSKWISSEDGICRWIICVAAVSCKWIASVDSSKIEVVDVSVSKEEVQCRKKEVQTWWWVDQKEQSRIKERFWQTERKSDGKNEVRLNATLQYKLRVCGSLRLREEMFHYAVHLILTPTGFLPLDFLPLGKKKKKPDMNC